MPYQRKDSPDWWVSYINQRGQRVRRATGTTNRKEAEALEAKWKLEAYRCKRWDEKTGRTLDEVLLTFLRGRSEKRSAEDDRMHARRLRDYIGGATNMNSLQASVIRDHVSRRKADGVSNATVNRELSLLSAAINYCNREHEWSLPNLVTGRKLKEPKGRVRWITEEEARALISAAGREDKAPYLQDFITLALHAGMRKEEMLGLEWARVDLKARLVRLEERHTKTAERRCVPLNEEAYRALLRRASFRAAQCPASTWVFCTRGGERVRDVKKSFATALRRAGIENFRIHDLRHTCAAWLVTAGAALMEVRDLLGHSSVTTTEIYAHLAPDNVRTAVARLESKSRSGHVTDLRVAENDS